MTMMDTRLRKILTAEDLKTEAPKMAAYFLEQERLNSTELQNRANGGKLDNPYTYDRLVSGGAAKNIKEFFDLVEEALSDHQDTLEVSTDNRVSLLYHTERLELDITTETIGAELTKREPGSMGRQAPFDGPRNLKPLLRDSVDDPENPGYKLLVLGYIHDNMTEFTCWAKTNKEAMARALWFEEFMEQYIWFFEYQGVGKVIYWGQGKDLIYSKKNGNILHGRPVRYYVRTETITQKSQKKMEDLIIKVNLQSF
jgi:hypothetical protein